MHEFFKHAAGKVASSAFDLYKNQTIRKYRDEFADDYAKAVRGAAGVSRKTLLGIVLLVPVAAAGLILLCFGAFAFALGVAETPDAVRTVQKVGGVFFCLIGFLCIVLPIIGVFVFTTESSLRRILDSDKWEKRIRGR